MPPGPVLRRAPPLDVPAGASVLAGAGAEAVGEGGGGRSSGGSNGTGD